MEEQRGENCKYMGDTVADTHAKWEMKTTGLYTNQAELRAIHVDIRLCGIAAMP